MHTMFVVNSSIFPPYALHPYAFQNVINIAVVNLGFQVSRFVSDGVRATSPTRVLGQPNERDWSRWCHSRNLWKKVKATNESTVWEGFSGFQMVWEGSSQNLTLTSRYLSISCIVCQTCKHYFAAMPAKPTKYVYISTWRKILKTTLYIFFSIPHILLRRSFG